jgi:UDP-N-acetylmuramyl pentapeptide phosphotransferase/UDP-N-acetylglucosamine-1-phosphate transferase
MINLHTLPTPRAGGIGIFFANLFIIFNPLGWTFLLSALPAFIAGLYDDFSSLTPKTRLIIQTFSAFLALFLLDSTVLGLGYDIHFVWYLGIPITLIAIIGMINAINIIDGFNGLASGVSIIYFASIAWLGFHLDDMALMQIAVVNIAGLIGFMVLNFPRGKIFLGDGGAYFLGFSLATLSLLLINRHHELSMLYPLALLFYPIFEVIFSIYRRKIVKKVKSTHPDSIHLHQLIYKRITKNNPATSVYIWKKVAPFVIVTTLFSTSDTAMLICVAAFALLYVYRYRSIVHFKASIDAFN